MLTNFASTTVNTVWLTLLCMIAFLAFACSDASIGDLSDSTSDVQNSTTEASPPEENSGVVFIKRTEPTRPNEDYMTAAGGGKLVVDEEGCLRFGRRGDLPVWPYEYSLTVKEGEMVILNGDGRVEARIGDRVEVGGGQVETGAGSTPEAARRGFEERRRELGIPDKCRGSLWYVTPGLRVIGQ